MAQIIYDSEKEELTILDNIKIKYGLLYFILTLNCINIPLNLYNNSDKPFQLLDYLLLISGIGCLLFLVYVIKKTAFKYRIDEVLALKKIFSTYIT